MRYSKTLSACLLLASATLTQAAVTVTGDVLNAGPVTWVPGARLLDVVNQARPNAESYWLAAAWLHQPLLEQQTRLKAGVLFDLKMLQRGALLRQQDKLADLAARLHQDVNRLPVTGRRLAVLDPIALEVGFARNYLVNEGDQLIYPTRPDSVTVLGAVAQPCTLPYRAPLQAREYLESCLPLPEAEADYLWLIGPDGQVKRVGIAGWNREEGVYAVAGSRILVPIRNDDPDLPTADLNEQLALFLATQPQAEVAP
ncbi:capsule biosynthesis GfcC family protein [Pseudomonas agarici]|uniref:capsule biosynthesis GfcC family protein n=1 Tax=Pseudomonas agarici TaxID=46677 RepID=UPI00031810EA|nr:capsule biosynthesis GfcC family protein [Pseudomonas agarici]NWB91938.1 capsule biosynthesis GfcC family protein [Pseudomonas agarici]NWC11288.1 capsule biosynthesis GfcC family protein [Pseudomonas agarici]SEL44404.1 Capsule biosynthesis GfcC [Pseudomonas agarici]